MLFKKVKRFCSKYHLGSYEIDLIYLFLSVSYRSIFAYMAGFSLYILLYYSYIPTGVMTSFAGAILSYFILRIYFIEKYKKYKFTQNDIARFESHHLVLLFFGGSLWGTAAILSAMYAPEQYEYIVLALIVSMSAGAISTLSPIYRAYVAFNIPMLLLLMIAFYYNSSIFYPYIEAVLVIFSMTVISASWHMHKSLKRYIELKELYAKSQKEISRINHSLEERVIKEVEYNRQKDQKMLEQSRLAQMGEMLSMIAHQWRQPLSAITATTGSISFQVQLGECNEDYIEKNLKKINEYVQYLSETITDFRDFFKIDKETVLTDMQKIVSGSLKIIGPSLVSQGIKIETYLEDTIEFKSYPNELKQVVLNILKNARDVFIENRITDPTINIKTVFSESQVELSICDNAGGIKDKNFKYLFDPYFTTKENLDGTGLGLYMSKLIVQDHCKGELNAYNNEKGACFTITIPLNPND